MANSLACDGMLTSSTIITKLPSSSIRNEAVPEPVARLVLALAGAASAIAAEIRSPATALDAAAGAVNADGDTQKKLDVIADEIVLEVLREAGAAAYLSEERDDAVSLDPDGGLIVACDPLDGSSNIGVNVSVGTIFSVLSAAGGALQPGRAQLAAGFFVYGPNDIASQHRFGSASLMDEEGSFVMIVVRCQHPVAGQRVCHQCLEQAALYSPDLYVAGGCACWCRRAARP